jgi:hypothetical protein
MSTTTDKPLDLRDLHRRAWDKQVGEAELELLREARTRAIRAQAEVNLYESALRDRVEKELGLHV